MSTTIGTSPDAIPASTGELSEIALAVGELLERVEALEDQLRAVTCALDMRELIGERPVRGRGLSYVLSRLDAVRNGTFGQRGVDQFAEELDRRRRMRSTGSGNDYEDRMRAEILKQSRLLGARILSNGGVEWPSPNGRHVTTAYAKEWGHDFDGRKRAALARQRATEEVLIPRRSTPTENGG